MSYGNLAVIFMVILVAVVGVGGTFIATYYLNRAVRQRESQSEAEPADARAGAASADVRLRIVTVEEREYA